MDENVKYACKKRMYPYNLERPAVHTGKADVAAMQDQIHERRL